MNDSSVVARRSGLVSAPAGEDLVMMDVVSGTFYALDDIGRFVWERLETPTPVSELLAEILRHYEVGPERCRQDILALLGDMHGRGLVEVAG